MPTRRNALQTGLAVLGTLGFPPAAFSLPSFYRYIFHAGFGNDGHLWYQYNNGNGDVADTQVPNILLSGSPSAALYNGLIYVFHQGTNNNGELWFNTYD